MEWIYCAPFKCNMSLQFCQTNQKTAKETMSHLLGSKVTMFVIEEYKVNRMLVCGNCPASRIDPDSTRRAFRLGVDALLERINRYDEHRGDPEVQVVKTRERYKRYLVNNREKIMEKRRQVRMDKRIDELKQKLGRRYQ